MTLLEAIRIALQSLWGSKLRSALTLLGVVISVAAVITVVTFVAGIQDYVREKVFNLGADIFVISKVTPVITNIDEFLEGQKRKDITMEDYDAIKESCQRCTLLGASTFNGSGHVKYEEQAGSEEWVRGMTPGVILSFDLDLNVGRVLTEGDVDRRADILGVGMDVGGKLMPGVGSLV